VSSKAYPRGSGAPTSFLSSGDRRSRPPQTFFPSLPLNKRGAPAFRKRRTKSANQFLRPFFFVSRVHPSSLFPLRGRVFAVADAAASLFPVAVREGPAGATGFRRFFPGVVRSARVSFFFSFFVHGERGARSAFFFPLSGGGGEFGRPLTAPLRGGGGPGVFFSSLFFPRAPFQTKCCSFYGLSLP